MLEYFDRPFPADRGLHLHDGFTDPPEFLAYQDFPERIAGFADAFRAQGVGPGTRVLFPFETSAPVILAFLALMELGAVPLSVKPLVMNTPRDGYREFLDRIARSHGAARILGVPSLAGIDLPVEVLPLPAADTRAERRALRVPADEDLAFVQFSSGSTSFPKGVQIRQGRLRTNLDMIVRSDGRRPEDKVSSWLPLYHDMGLVGGLLSCFAVGCDLLLAEPIGFLFDARGWWEHLAREGVMGTVIPNFAVDYSLRQLQDVDPEEIAAIDLSAVRAIYLGSEPINLPNLHAFLDLMAPAGLKREVFMPCYGMAEAVLLVSTRPAGSPVRAVDSPAGVPTISVGRPLPEYAVRLRDEHGALCAENEAGEIELAGGTLADHYLDRDRPLVEADGYYRTGDIGFLDDGELFITGRISDRIKVNGQSLFAPDFEQAVERLSFVREGRTAVGQSEGRIVLLAEVDREAREDIPGSRARIVDHLAHALGVTLDPADIHYLRPGQLPRTSSGKLRRQAVMRSYERGELDGLTLPPARPAGGPDGA
ncbi:AMP-binding protein [Kitasatospora sp. NBC_01560]|uniref:AMP-binding protein n=1 Tax=Kitasatospora sp. NBC_01560 TaxID=2975965 RepID=UPI0038662464